MTLEDLGYNEDLEQYRREQNLGAFGVARVIAEHRERYAVKTAENEFEAEIIGNLRFSAGNRTDLPAVGDWVAIEAYDDNKVLIHALFPRKTILERNAVGRQGEKQIIATNVDHAFIVQAVDGDFNINRIERYLTICNASYVKPVIILSKIDLLNDIELSGLILKIEERVRQIPIIPISNESPEDIDRLAKWIIRGQTYCLLGSSGVGKSTLLNNLSGNPLMKTNSISASTSKGRHVTSHRQLVILEQGGIIIDNPGMREVGISDSSGGLEKTFETIARLTEECKFKDCTHTTETDCAVLAALDRGEIELSSYDNYLKMQKEKMHFESTVAEKRKKDKVFGKMLKQYKNTRNSNEY